MPIYGDSPMKTKLIVRVTGTRAWQCKHYVFNSIFEFEEHCLKANPKKAKQVNGYIDLPDLCSIMSDCFVVWSYEWA